MTTGASCLELVHGSDAARTSERRNRCSFLPPPARCTSSLRGLVERDLVLILKAIAPLLSDQAPAPSRPLPALHPSDQLRFPACTPARTQTREPFDSLGARAPRQRRIIRPSYALTSEMTRRIFGWHAVLRLEATNRDPRASWRARRSVLERSTPPAPSDDSSLRRLREAVFPDRREAPARPAAPLTSSTAASDFCPPRRRTARRLGDRFSSGPRHTTTTS